MKSPLLFLTLVFAVCICSGCRNTSRCYHYEKPFGDLKGNAKMITDTVYGCLGNETVLPVQVVEYQFDSLNRLTQEQMYLYSTSVNEEREECSTTLCHARTIKNRYDRDGRKVEIHTKQCAYQEESTNTTYTAMRLIQLEGNHEKWEMTQLEGGAEDSIAYQVDKYYSKDSISIVKTNLHTNVKTEQLLVFDEYHNLIEKLLTNEDGSVQQMLYDYEESKQLRGTEDSTYRYDEFDNEGNWLKRYEYDDEKRMLTMLHRRIEYRR